MLGTKSLTTERSLQTLQVAFVVVVPTTDLMPKSDIILLFKIRRKDVPGHC